MNFSINSSNGFFSRSVDKAQNRQNLAFQRLASMNRINSAKDDPSGLAIINRMTAQIEGANQATRNANDGISFAQTAQSGLSQITSNLQRIRTLSVQAANGTLNSSDRQSIQNEVKQLTDTNSSITESSSFNGQSIFPATDKSVSFQVGSEGGTGNQVSIDLKPLDQLKPVDVSSVSAAQNAISQIDAELEAVSKQASNFGATENRFAAAISTNESFSISQQASRSRIRDTDVAKEASELIKSQILEKAGIAMTAQANQSRKSILSLLGGR
jgi:flagellin